MFLLFVTIIIITIFFFIRIISKNIASNISIINDFLSKHCSDPAVFDSKNFVWTKTFRDNQKTILAEYENYTKTYMIPKYKDINVETSSCDINGGWKTLFLKIYGVSTTITKMFPVTTKLIEECPCTLAFFSVFEPNTKLVRHRGVYKGVIRYHLPLIIPDEWDKCFINVNGRVLNWRIGEDLMFDDMFLHHAENNTNQKRVILFLDIKRDFKNPLLNLLNTILLKFIKSNDMLVDTVAKANSFNLLANK
jgi:ornithine lipid ester-linked acyl 2-hydroxylase